MCSSCPQLAVPQLGLREAGYDEEARYFEGGVRLAKRADLVEAINKLVGEAYDNQLELLRASVLAEAKKKIKAGSDALSFADVGRGCALRNPAY